MLEALLEVADSIMTYRSRYLARVQLGPVLDLLLTDETNPRSVAFQIVECVAHVEQAAARFASQRRLARAAAGRVAAGHDSRDRQPATGHGLYAKATRSRSDWTLLKLEVTLPKLSDAINHKYLIHTGPTQRLAEINPE